MLSRDDAFEQSSERFSLPFDAAPQHRRPRAQIERRNLRAGPGHPLARRREPEPESHGQPGRKIVHFLPAPSHQEIELAEAAMRLEIAHLMAPFGKQVTHSLHELTLVL